MSVPPEVESLVADAPVSAHVGTCVDDRPHVAPVWYGYRDGVVYFLTGGKKLANARQNPRVSLSIESAVDGDVDWNVTLLGRATVSDDQDRIDWASDWIFEKYREDEDDSHDPGRTDGGLEPNADEAELDEDYALVEVEIGSASWTVYD